MLWLLVLAAAGLPAFVTPWNRPRRVLLIAGAAIHTCLAAASLASPPEPLPDLWIALDEDLPFVNFPEATFTGCYLLFLAAMTLAKRGPSRSPGSSAWQRRAGRISSFPTLRRCRASKSTILSTGFSAGPCRGRRRLLQALDTPGMKSGKCCKLQQS
jgi:hypothetical protein